LANIALRTLGLATTIFENYNLDPLTDFLLCPMELGGADICEPQTLGHCNYVELIHTIFTDEK
jgi:hypothetical protein